MSVECHLIVESSPKPACPLPSLGLCKVSAFSLVSIASLKTQRWAELEATKTLKGWVTAFRSHSSFWEKGLELWFQELMHTDATTFEKALCKWWRVYIRMVSITVLCLTLITYAKKTRTCVWLLVTPTCTLWNLLHLKTEDLMWIIKQPSVVSKDSDGSSFKSLMSSLSPYCLL